MKESPPSTPLISIALPLFGSERFYDSIVHNLDGIRYPNVEVLVSDRHLADSTLGRLRLRYGDDERFRFFAARDELDWVGHYNMLLREARGDLFRWLPHDDLLPSCALTAMVEALLANRDAVLVYTPVLVIDDEGRRVPELDRPPRHPNGSDADWPLQVAVSLFHRGYCEGAFKGLFRRDVAIRRGLFLRRTRGLVHAERCWLAAMAMAGRFVLLETHHYWKRYHDTSTHSGWAMGRRERWSACRVLLAILWQQRSSLGSWGWSSYALLVGALADELRRSPGALTDWAEPWMRRWHETLDRKLRSITL